MFQTLLDQVNSKLRKTPLFYITNDPERGVGLETVLENFHIVSMDDSSIVDEIKKAGLSIFSYEHETKALNSVYRNSVKLLEEAPVRNFIQKNAQDGKLFQTFKISSGFEQSAKEYGAQLINTSAELNMRFENKISQYQQLAPHGINFPKTVITGLSESSYDELMKTFGAKFVIQFNRGHTGSGTHFITNKSEYAALASKYPLRIARISEFLDGIPYTLNACVANNGVFIGGLNYQITGVEGIAQSKSATVGNDFSYRIGLDDKLLEKIISQVKLIGNTMSEAGFRGLFGVDLIVKGPEVFIIEINARQPASIPFYTKLQIMTGQAPLSLLHIAAFLGIDNGIHADEYTLTNLKPINAGQIFLRNTEASVVKINNEVSTGIYRYKSAALAGNGQNIVARPSFELEFIKPAYSIDAVDNGSDDNDNNNNDTAQNEANDQRSFLILTQEKGKQIKPGRELARIQAFHSLIDQKTNQPYDWVMDTLLEVKKLLNPSI